MDCHAITHQRLDFSLCFKEKERSKKKKKIRDTFKFKFWLFISSDWKSKNGFLLAVLVIVNRLFWTNNQWTMMGEQLLNLFGLDLVSNLAFSLKI